MDIIDFLQVEIDPMNKSDIRNGYYIKDILGDEDYILNDLPQVSLTDTFIKSLGTFKLYKDNNLVVDLFEKKKHMDYKAVGILPFDFGVKIITGNNNQIVPRIKLPMFLNESSYVFLGNAFHHALKDVNVKERKIRDRVAEVIPMFYEMLCSDYEEKDLSKEILKIRLTLLEIDKDNSNESAKKMQYFNSYYYALALYNKYRKDENKVLILRLITRVLKGEISTLDLLEMLNLYGMDLDYIVSCELEKIKEYVLK